MLNTFTAGEYVKYAQIKSSDADMRSAKLSFEGKDKMAFWKMDDVDYDESDTYTYDQMYGVQRYNFPMLYKYWNYKTQDYYDPDRKVTLTVHAVKDGCTDKGVQTLVLTSSGKGAPASDRDSSSGKKWNDVSDSAWYSEAVSYVTDKNLFDSCGKAAGGADNSVFGPSQPMTRHMLVTALRQICKLTA